MGKLSYYGRVRGMAYDGSKRKRLLGDENKTISIHLDKNAAIEIASALLNFVLDAAVKDVVYLTAFKEQENDTGMPITITSPIK